MFPYKQWIRLSALGLASLMVFSSALLPQASNVAKASRECNNLHRRAFWQDIAIIGFGGASLSTLLPSESAWAAGSSLSDLQSATQQARKQLDAVPEIIQKGEWDKIRAILITPPLSDFWTKTKRTTPILLDIANAVGDAGGDELNVLELREELQSHLRYLDMSAYNNVFNPIATEGTSGATKELIRSYYEDPKDELKASVTAFDSLLKEISSTAK